MPGTFEFRLEPLLDHRKSIEDRKKRELSSARGVLEHNLSEIRLLSVESQALVTALHGAAAARRGADRCFYEVQTRRIDAELALRHARTPAFRAAYIGARDEFLNATRDRRVIEKLKERMRRAFDAEEARLEEIELDECNARRHESTRRKRAAG